jgi:ankyrin repeat protein
VQFLLIAGAAINICDTLQETPLHLAARAGNLDTVKLLLQVCASLSLALSLHVILAPTK